ncbi:Hsp70 family protein [Sciscionella marina]|uniref:Hsp70 family protein n=1 Tax=Sciscionella marina TaxID=508770 RepID=UPI0003779F4F|nr:Hsp70 family protein [Sciscionella marina]
MHVLSVDLGTSNTVAVLAAHGRQPRVVEIDGSATMPSAVFAAEDGSLVVGKDAERRARLDPSRFEPNPKRRVDEQQLLLGDRVITVIDALAAVLYRVGEETVRQLGGQRPDEVRLTHPAQWGELRRAALVRAARAAGLGHNLLLVPEPVAAAAHFASFPGKALAPGQALAVYDLGAGTFDCAVVGATQNGYSVLAEAGLPDLGGLDVDQALFEHVGRQISQHDPARWQRLIRPRETADRRAQRALREDVKAAKEALSRHPQADVPMPEPFEDVLVTRPELESLIRPSMLRSVELLAGTVRGAGFDPNRLAGIYLVGGSSRIPLVATLIGESLHVVATSLDQPETAVALGAHHVSREGIAGRTQDYPRSAPAPWSAPQQPGPQQQPGFPPGHPGRPPQAFPQPNPGYQQAPAAAQPAAKRRPGNRTLIGAGAALVVVAALVVGGLFLFDGSGKTVDAAECGNLSAQRDSEGFTDCLRQLAGDIGGQDSCNSAQGKNPAPIAVTCRVDSGAHTLSYYQGNDTPKVPDGPSGDNKEITARWQGNGLTGDYTAGNDESGKAVLEFSVQGRPIAGKVVAGADKDPNKLADYFEQEVMPGS